MRKEIIPVLFALCFISSLALALVAVRWIHSGHPAFLFLIWNLFLAWLPLAIALVAITLRRFPPLAVAGGAGWLLFLPNAPYLLTDLLHLGRWGGAPFWYDLLMLLVFALAGLLLGFVSLEMMRAMVQDYFGRLAGWLFACTALVLSSVGVYMGRFLRWNSWDALLRPTEILADLWLLLQQPWMHRQAYVFSLGLAAVLVCAYIVLALTPRMQMQRAHIRIPRSNDSRPASALIGSWRSDSVSETAINLQSNHGSTLVEPWLIVNRPDARLPEGEVEDEYEQ